MAYAPVRQATIVFNGGLDLVTPPTQVDGGRLLVCKNWVADPTGGYREFDGFERVDGQTSPTEGTFVSVTMDDTSGFVVGETVNQATTLASGVILQIETEGLYLVSTTGSFLDTFVITGVTSAETEAATSDGFAGVLLNDDETLNEVRYTKELFYRDLIAKVPGEGSVTGAFHHQAIRLAVRNAVGGAEAKLFKSTTSGWTEIDLGHIIFFDTLLNEPDIGTVISDGTGNSATVLRVVVALVGGTTGYVVVSGFTTGFAISDVMDFNGGATTFATVTVAAAANTLSASGRYEWLAHNFKAVDSTSFLVYAANGLDSAFEVDPVNSVFIPIISDQTDLATDTPSYLAVYRNHLFLGFDAGFMRNSLPGNPYVFDAAAGAQENATGAPVTGFDSVPAALLTYTQRQTLQMVGRTAQSTTDPFFIDTASARTGGSPYTVQHIGTSHSLDDRGIIPIDRVDAFGDFENAAITKRIRPLINDFKPDAHASVVIGRDNMYVLFKQNGEGITTTFMEDNSAAFAQIDLGVSVECASNGEDETGAERILVGSDDGFVYELLRGRSFDGEVAERWLRPVYHHHNSPGVRKRWKRAFLNTIVDGRATLTIATDYGFGSIESRDHVPDDAPTTGISALWDVAEQDISAWDASILSNAYVDLKGHGDSIGLIVYHESATDDLVTLKDITYQFKGGAFQRGAR